MNRLIAPSFAKAGRPVKATKAPAGKLTCFQAGLPAEAVAKAGRRGLDSFEPSGTVIAPFAAVFLQLPDPHLSIPQREMVFSA